MIYSNQLNIRFVAERTFSSFFILLKETGKAFSHVGAITDPNEQGARYEFGARVHIDKSLTGNSGVQLRPLDYAEFEYQETISIPVTAWEHEHFWMALSRVSGERYSKRSILGFVTSFNFDDQHGFICSSLIPWGFYAAGMLPHELITRERFTDPEDCYYLCLGLRDGRTRYV